MTLDTPQSSSITACWRRPRNVAPTPKRVSPSSAANQFTRLRLQVSDRALQHRHLHPAGDVDADRVRDDRVVGGQHAADRQAVALVRVGHQRARHRHRQLAGVAHLLQRAFLEPLPEDLAGRGRVAAGERRACARRCPGPSARSASPSLSHLPHRPAPRSPVRARTGPPRSMTAVKASGASLGARADQRTGPEPAARRQSRAPRSAPRAWLEALDGLSRTPPDASRRAGRTRQPLRDTAAQSSATRTGCGIPRADRRPSTRSSRGSETRAAQPCADGRRRLPRPAARRRRRRRRVGRRASW